ncbi:MAG TPA: hypothetical protein VD993_00215 [Chitinophagaceae bacterium]|nr:hypothetical protein [Chitinophagaceae bacterium]
MQTKRPFALPFINRLDRYLLLHKPEIWSTRAHLVLYYGIIFIAILTAIAFIVPDDPRKRSPSPYWISFVSLISLVALVGWLIYLLRFNVFKRYGLISRRNRLITFILYSISIGIFVLFCYVEPYVETVRANAAYTSEEIVRDINTVNVGIVRLEYDSLDHRWDKDTVLVTDRAMEEYEEAVDYTIPDTVDYAAVEVSHKELITREALGYRLQSADSVQKINDSLYVFFQCPDYVHLYTYPPTTDSVEVLSSIQLYRQEVVNYTPPSNRQQIRDELAAIKEKYQWYEERTDYYDVRPAREERLRRRYAVSEISDSMYNIVDRKERWMGENLEVWIRFFVYTTLILSMLVFAFRHTTARTFFLTLLAAVILIVLTSLIVAFSSYEEETIFGSLLFYFVLSFGLSVAAFSSKKRRAVSGIATNLFMWLLPFIPICMVGWYYASLRKREDFENRVNYDYSLMEKHFVLAEVGGILLLLILVATYFHSTYRAWYASPEN